MRARRCTDSCQSFSDASFMGGIVKLLFELSVDSHEAATFLCEDADLFRHVGWTLASRVAVEFGLAVGVVPLTV